MFELNSIRELNHRLTRLVDLSGQKQYLGMGKHHPTNSTDSSLIDAAEDISDNKQTNYRFPTHMNLEIAKNVSSSQNTNNANHAHQENALMLERQVQRLKEQNLKLTHEVGEKSNQMTALEQEKRTLIKQLFHRSNPPTNNQAQPNNKVPSGKTTPRVPSHESRRKNPGSQSLNNILANNIPQVNNRNAFDGAKSSVAKTKPFLGSGQTSIFKSASSLYQQHQF